MRYLIIILFCSFSLQIVAQDQQLALQYFRNGEYEKAASLLKPLHEQNPYNAIYLSYLIDSYQQLEKYDEVLLVTQKQLDTYKNQEYLLIEIGYNYQLQHNPIKATEYYNKALKSIEKNPSSGYSIGTIFKDNNLLDYALMAFQKGMELVPTANYNFQIALIYGEKGEIEQMFNTYLDLISSNETYISTVKSYLGRFITDDTENEHSILLRKLIVKRLQSDPIIIWNNLLSWVFMQQKEYDKALIQEKAIFKRNGVDLNSIVEIGQIAFDDKVYETAKNCFQFVLENKPAIEMELNAKLYLLEIDMNTSTNYTLIETQFLQLFEQYGINQNTIGIQAIYAEFLAFKLNQPEKGISTLKEALKLTNNEFQVGHLKTKLADILVFTNKFSSALIYYTQVQNDLKNHTIGQEARFKIAQTSYFNGDFDWAQSQLKVLKNSTSQLIANDALDLNLLITDNAVKDSLKIALKTYAKADLLAFQNKDKAAIDTLQLILTKFKGHPIEDETLFKQAKLYEKLELYTNAEQNYLQIIAINKEDILADDAHYYLAELYLNKLKNPEKAKEYYQKIIFDYPSSIYVVDARKKFRNLRGDLLN